MITPMIRSTLRVVLGSAVIIALLGLGSAPPSSGSLPTEIPDLSQRMNEFTFDWLQQCAQSSDATSNLVVSPQSIFHGLAMSYIASGGATREELARALHFPDDDQELMRQLGEVRHALIAGTGPRQKIEVSVANSAWLDTTYATFQKDYLGRLQQPFEASLHQVKFRDAGKAAREVNAWVSKKTHGEIRTVVTAADFASRSGPGVIDEPGLVTVNAVYFKGDWASKFEKDSTRPCPFRLPGGTQEDTLMMHQNSKLLYSESEKFQFVEIPYIGESYSMYVLLPREVLPVREMLGCLNTQAVLDMKRSASWYDVDVLLPKFEITTHQNAKEMLGTMGVTAAFDGSKANFDRMIVKKSEAYRIYLSEVYHDARVEVHEEGAKASAVTTSLHFSVGCSASGQMPLRPAEFHADHPFLFLIVHNPTCSVLFAGWYATGRS